MGIFGNNDLNQSGLTKGTNTGTTTGATTSAFSPYKRAQPMLDKLLADAMGYYKSGQLSPYVGLSGTTKQGLSGLTSGAMSGVSPLRQALGTYSDFAGGGMDVGTGGQDAIYRSALRARNVGTSGLQGILQGAMQNRDVGSGAQTGIYEQSANAPSFSEGNLAGVARGDFLDREDPNFERLLGRASEQAETAARMAAGAKGRYGGDYAQTEVGRTVGDLQAQSRYQQYQDERGRQVEANSLMDAMKQARLGLGLNAANSASGIQAGNEDRALSGLGLGLNTVNSRMAVDAANRDRALAGLGIGLNAANSKTAIQSDNRTRMLQGAAGVPGAFQASLDPFRELLKVGGIKEADTLARQGRYANNLGSLAQLLGVAQPYGTATGVTTGTQTGTQTGTTSGTTQGPDNTLSQGLGLGLGGASLLKMLKDAGGLSGLFGGLF
jgi:hypothetical protein